MALPVVRRRVRGGRPRRRVPSAGLPVVLGADDVLVRLLGASSATMAGAPADLGARGSAAVAVAVTHALLPAFVVLGPPRRRSRRSVRCSRRCVDGPERGATGGERTSMSPTRRPGDGCGGFGAGPLRSPSSFAALGRRARRRGVRAASPIRRATRFAAIRPPARPRCALPGWLAVGSWRFVSAVSGGRLIATNTNSPYLVVGRRRFMPPVP